MLSYAQAIERLLAAAPRLPAERRSLADAAGRILAEAVVSPMDLPSFDHSAMDGYALRVVGDELAAGSEHVVRGSQAAGDDAVQSMGDAWEIMTGAQLPKGLDAVIALERTELLASHLDGTPSRIRLRDALVTRHNVRLAGSDVVHGATVAPAGTRLDPSHLMLLAALGVADVPVVRAPRVAVICTGKELQAELAVPLPSERIYNSNGPYLVAALQGLGAEVVSCVTVDDTVVTYEAALRHAVDAGVDLVVSTGAVSMGRYDFVPDSLRRFDAQYLFHKLAVRPGKPQLAACLPHGPIVFGLPGTPMAVAVGLRFLLTPLLRAMRGQKAESVRHAVLDTPQSPKPGLRHFLRATVHEDARGQAHASVLRQQQPFRIQPYAAADSWVILSEDVGECMAGQIVEVASLHPTP